MRRLTTVNLGCIYRRAAALVLVLAMMAFVGTTTAQAQANDPFCSELSKADCALLNASYETMRDVTSLHSNLEMELLIDKLPEMEELPIQTFTLSIAQATVFEIDPAANESLAELRALTSDPTALEDDFARVFQLYFDTLTGITMDSNFTLSFPKEVAALIEEEAQFPIPNSFEIGSRVVEGTSYSNIGDILSLFPGINVRGDIWFGVEFASLTDLLTEAMEQEQALSSAGNAQMSEGEALLFSQYLLRDMGVASGPLLPTLAASELTAVGAPYLVVERLDDATVDGESVAVFRTAVDYAALFADPEVESLLTDLLQNEDLLGNDALAPDEAESVAFLLGIYGPEILKDLNLEVIEFIDPATNYLVSTEVDMDWDLTDLAAIAAIAGEEFAMDSDELPQFTLSATTRYTEIGEPVSVDVPETAIILNVKELIDLAELSTEGLFESFEE